MSVINDYIKLQVLFIKGGIKKLNKENKELREENETLKLALNSKKRMETTAKMSLKELASIKEKNKRLKKEKQEAVNLINDIWNITTHLDYSMSKDVANDEIKYIHEITNKYFEEGTENE